MPIAPEIRAYHAAQSPADQRTCRTLSKVIDRHLTGAECKLWHRHPVWFLDGNPIVGYSKLKGCIRLLFWSGQSFDEPGLSPEGTFKAAEARYTAAKEIDEGDLVRWLSKAAEIQWDYKNLVKRKGKLERLPRPVRETAPAPKPTAPKEKQPVLLSGGNPQIPKGDGDAPVQAYIDAMPGWKQDVGRRLDELIVRTIPGVRKAVRWNTPFYGVEGKGWFLAFHCITRYVKVTFFRGTSLKPEPPVGSKMKHVRYLHIHEGDWGRDIDEAMLAKWIKQASKLPGETCF